MGYLNTKTELISDRKNPIIFSFELLDKGDLLYIKAKNKNFFNINYDFSFTKRDLDNLECSIFKPKDMEDSLKLIKNIFENNKYKFSIEEKDDQLTIIINNELNIILKRYEENDELRKTKMFKLNKIENDKFIESIENIDENQYSKNLII